MLNQQRLCLSVITLIAFSSLTIAPLKGQAQVSADFTHTPTQICTIPVVVNFQDNSAGSPVKWTWDFGDGNTSEAQNPLKIYLSAGTYQVQLIVEDASNNKDTIIKPIQVNYLKADFTGLPNSMTCASNAIVTLNLVNASKGNGNISYAWDINENGSHTTIDNAPYYKLLNADDPNKYLVAKLTASNDFGCVSTITDTIGMGTGINIVKDSAASMIMANEECTTSDGWTYYSYHDAIYPDRSILLLAIKKNGNNIGTIGDGTFQLIISSTEGAGSNIAVLLSNPLITNESGFWAMNRYWQVNATHQPTTPVGVRFYFNTQDLNDLNSSYATHNMTYQKLIFYKTLGGNPDPTSNLDGATSISSFLNGSSADETHWVYTNLHGQKHLAEFEVCDFTGGGGGGGTGNDQVLPLQLISFTGNKTKGNTVQLNWITTNEVNVATIEVESSIDSRNFAQTGSVPPKGNSAGNNYYSFTYTEPKTASNSFYRLKITNKDGKASYSQVIQISFQSNAITMYPVPVKNNLLNIKLSKFYEGDVIVNIYNSTGKVALQTKKQLGTDNLIQLNTSSLPKGFYKVICYSNNVKIGDGNIIIQ